MSDAVIAQFEKQIEATDSRYQLKDLFISRDYWIIFGEFIEKYHPDKPKPKEQKVSFEVFHRGILTKSDIETYRTYFYRTLKEYDDLRFKKGEDNTYILRNKLDDVEKIYSEYLIALRKVAILQSPLIKDEFTSSLEELKMEIRESLKMKKMLDDNNQIQLQWG